MPKQELRKLIKEEVSKLICETHPYLCELRDKNYDLLEQIILAELSAEKYKEAPSIQTAVANLEMELS